MLLPLLVADLFNSVVRMVASGAFEYGMPSTHSANAVMFPFCLVLYYYYNSYTRNGECSLGFLLLRIQASFLTHSVSCRAVDTRLGNSGRSYNVCARMLQSCLLRNALRCGRGVWNYSWWYRSSPLVLHWRART